MNTKTKEANRIEAARILKDVRQRIQSLEDGANAEAVNQCWHEVCVRLETIEPRKGTEEADLLDQVMKLFAESHG